MVYDDEKLSPSAFEQMAKEYAKNKKKLSDEILKIFETIICIKNALTKFKLNKEYTKKLDKISKNSNTLYSYIKENNYKLNNKNFNKNYCELLVMLITSCVDARKLLDQNNQDFEMKNAIDDIAKTSCTMFGVCKYRHLN